MFALAALKRNNLLAFSQLFYLPSRLCYLPLKVLQMKGNIDFISCGLPCQGTSTLGKRTGLAHEVRVDISLGIKF